VFVASLQLTLCLFCRLFFHVELSECQHGFVEALVLLFDNAVGYCSSDICIQK